MLNACSSANAGFLTPAVRVRQARFTVGLPAQGRNICGSWAWDILGTHLPAIARDTLYHDRHDAQQVTAHVESYEDQEHLRANLAEAGLVAFVANGSILPRASGASVCDHSLHATRLLSKTRDPIELSLFSLLSMHTPQDRPMSQEDAVPFATPGSLLTELPLHNGGKVSGMGIPKGITLIVGGGFHGKSTLLQALEVGVYSHVPGDGREFVVADPYAMKVCKGAGRGRPRQAEESPR